MLSKSSLYKEILNGIAKLIGKFICEINKKMIYVYGGCNKWEIMNFFEVFLIKNSKQ